jgi:hypothetical protein
VPQMSQEPDAAEGPHLRRRGGPQPGCPSSRQAASGVPGGRRLAERIGRRTVYTQGETLRKPSIRRTQRDCEPGNAHEGQPRMSNYHFRPLPESKGPNWRKWRTFLCVMYERGIFEWGGVHHSVGWRHTLPGEIVV